MKMKEIGLRWGVRPWRPWIHQWFPICDYWHHSVAAKLEDSSTWLDRWVFFIHNPALGENDTDF